MFYSAVDQHLRSLCFENGKARPNNKDVRELERVLGVPLPSLYRQFLEVTNGGAFEDEVYYRDQRSGRDVLFGWFLSVDEVLESVDSFAEALPSTVVPIANDGGDNLHCLGFTAPDVNRVYFHDHGAGWQWDADRMNADGQDVPSELAYQTVYLLAPSFEEFVLSLHR